jgi:hypothetical protein
MYRTIYNSKGRDYNTRVIPIYIYIYIYMSSQAEGGGSTWNLKRKIIKKAVGSDLVKTYTSWSWEEIKQI